MKKMSKIRKVKMLKGIEKTESVRKGLSLNDLVIVASEHNIEKVEGDPVSYLLKRAKGTNDIRKGSEINDEGEEIDNLERQRFYRQALANMVLVPEEKWRRIKALMENFPIYESIYKIWKKQLPHSPDELHLTALSQLDSARMEWFEELRKAIIDEKNTT